MKKADREAIFNKFGGKCAYCGCELQKGWHVDHKEPVRRKMDYCYEERKLKYNGKMDFPERDNLENKIPSCASCNIFKHSQPLESFRVGLSMLVNSLNTQGKHNIYKIAKRYGLITENPKEIVFYFETFEKSP